MMMLNRMGDSNIPVAKRAHARLQPDLDVIENISSTMANISSSIVAMMKEANSNKEILQYAMQKKVDDTAALVYETIPATLQAVKTFSDSERINLRTKMIAEQLKKFDMVNIKNTDDITPVFISTSEELKKIYADVERYYRTVKQTSDNLKHYDGLVKKNVKTNICSITNVRLYMNISEQVRLFKSNPTTSTPAAVNQGAPSTTTQTKTSLTAHMASAWEQFQIIQISVLFLSQPQKLAILKGPLLGFDDTQFDNNDNISIGSAMNDFVIISNFGTWMKYINERGGYYPFSALNPNVPISIMGNVLTSSGISESSKLLVGFGLDEILACESQPQNVLDRYEYTVRRLPEIHTYGSTSKIIRHAMGDAIAQNAKGRLCMHNYYKKCADSNGHPLWNIRNVFETNVIPNYDPVYENKLFELKSMIDELVYSSECCGRGGASDAKVLDIFNSCLATTRAISSFISKVAKEEVIMLSSMSQFEDKFSILSKYKNYGNGTTYINNFITMQELKNTDTRINGLLTIIKDQHIITILNGYMADLIVLRNKIETYKTTNQVNNEEHIRIYDVVVSEMLKKIMTIAKASLSGTGAKYSLIMPNNRSNFNGQQSSPLVFQHAEPDYNYYMTVNPNEYGAVFCEPTVTVQMEKEMLDIITSTIFNPLITNVPVLSTLTVLDITTKLNSQSPFSQLYDTYFKLVTHAGALTNTNIKYDIYLLKEIKLSELNNRELIFEYLTATQRNLNMATGILNTGRNIAGFNTPYHQYRTFKYDDDIGTNQPIKLTINSVDKFYDLLLLLKYCYNGKYCNDDNGKSSFRGGFTIAPTLTKYNNYTYVEDAIMGVNNFKQSRLAHTTTRYGKIFEIVNDSGINIEASIHYMLSDEFKTYDKTKSLAELAAMQYNDITTYSPLCHTNNNKVVTIPNKNKPLVNPSDFIIGNMLDIILTGAYNNIEFKTTGPSGVGKTYTFFERSATGPSFFQTILDTYGASSTMMKIEIFEFYYLSLPYRQSISEALKNPKIHVFNSVASPNPNVPGTFLYNISMVPQSGAIPIENVSKTIEAIEEFRKQTTNTVRPTIQNTNSSRSILKIIASIGETSNKKTVSFIDCPGQEKTFDVVHHNTRANKVASDLAFMNPIAAIMGHIMVMFNTCISKYTTEFFYDNITNHCNLNNQIYNNDQLTIKLTTDLIESIGIQNKRTAAMYAIINKNLMLGITSLANLANQQDVQKLIAALPTCKPINLDSQSKIIDFFEPLMVCENGDISLNLDNDPGNTGTGGGFLNQIITPPTTNANTIFYNDYMSFVMKVYDTLKGNLNGLYTFIEKITDLPPIVTSGMNTYNWDHIYTIDKNYVISNCESIMINEINHAYNNTQQPTVQPSNNIPLEQQLKEECDTLFGIFIDESLQTLYKDNFGRRLSLRCANFIKTGTKWYTVTNNIRQDLVQIVRIMKKKLKLNRTSCLDPLSPQNLKHDVGHVGLFSKSANMAVNYFVLAQNAENATISNTKVEYLRIFDSLKYNIEDTTTQTMVTQP